MEGCGVDVEPYCRRWEGVLTGVKFSKAEVCSMAKILGVLMMLVAMLTLGGCSSPPTPKQLIGRWVEDKEDRRYEFTPNLYSLVENGSFVDAGTWTLDEKGVLRLRSLTRPHTEEWKLTGLSEDGFRVDLSEARFRSFNRVPLDGTIFDKRLVGLWRTEGKQPEIVEFTEQGTLAGIFQRLDHRGGTLFPIGVQANVSTAGSARFYLEGYIGNKRAGKGIQTHPFSIEGNRLLWGVGLKRPPRVYRKITIDDIAGLPQPTATPSDIVVPKTKTDEKKPR